MSERKTQYRIVPANNLLWVVQSSQNNWVTHETVYDGDWGTNKFIRVKHFRTEQEAEAWIDKEIDEAQRAIDNELHLKTPPRIYP